MLHRLNIGSVGAYSFGYLRAVVESERVYRVNVQLFDPLRVYLGLTGCFCRLITPRALGDFGDCGFYRHVGLIGKLVALIAKRCVRESVLCVYVYRENKIG